MSCTLALINNAPAVVFFIDEDNPYPARFGTEKDEWGQEVWMTKMKNLLHDLLVKSVSLIL